MNPRMNPSSSAEDGGSGASWDTARLPFGNFLVPGQSTMYWLTLFYFMICRLWLGQMNLRIVL